MSRNFVLGFVIGMLVTVYPVYKLTRVSYFNQMAQPGQITASRNSDIVLVAVDKNRTKMLNKIKYGTTCDNCH